MDYFSNVTYLTLGGHVELEKYRYFYFVLSFTIYLLIICCNTLVISAIYKNQRLHEPMYIFIAALLCNALCGTIAFYPKLLIDLLLADQMITHQACLFQAFWLYTYGVSEYTLLSVMAYDRYVSICKPLQYTTLIRIYTVRKLLFLSWFLPAVEIGSGIVLTSQLELCRFRLNRIYCDNYSIAKLSCNDTSASNWYGLFLLLIAVFLPAFYIICSYIQILTVCLKNSSSFRKKALQTCLPHLIVFTMCSIISCFEVINNRFQSKQVPHIIAMIMSVENLIIPPLLNPIIYGFKMQEIYFSIRRLIIYKRRVHVTF